jgi:8-oxo-dGTP diphosphatase
VNPVFGTRVERVRYVHRPSAYVIVRDADERIAVVRTRKGTFLPGGGIEEGESPESAARREVAEECGLLVEVREAIGRATQIVKRFEKDSVFFAGTVIGSGEQTETDHELLWLEAGDAVALLTHESHRWAVLRLTGAG